MRLKSGCFLISASWLLLCGCANQTTPTGGKRDETPPKLLSVTPSDSLKNAGVKKIELEFDEYVTVADAIKEVQVQPLLDILPVVIGKNKTVTLRLVDSLLEPNTTYRISFGKSIRDLHESNPFPDYTYTFSTGDHFDSLTLSGSVIDASTGLPDSTGVIVALYNATESDSIVVRKKPKYFARIGGSGKFVFRGLPQRQFKIYAIKDISDDLIYNQGNDLVAFNDQLVTPGDTTLTGLSLRLFMEPDTGTGPKTLKVNKSEGLHDVKNIAKYEAKPALTLSVPVDTVVSKRTFDITRPLSFSLSHAADVVPEKATLTFDSAGAAGNLPFSLSEDTTRPAGWLLKANWKENTVYTLKFAKGFGKDSAGTETMPAKYSFRSKEDADYSKISVHLPTRFYRAGYLLQVAGGADTVYQALVTDTLVNLARLRPEKYTIRVIEDRNGNLKWDTGNLFMKRQPEVVIPYKGDIDARPGFEYVIDFDKEAKKGS